MRPALLALVGFLAFAALARAQEVTPVANAGPDITVDCAGQLGTPIALDGTGSSIGDGFTYLWSAPNTTFDDATSLTPIGTFPAGQTEVTLTVTFTDPNADPNDPNAASAVPVSASDTALITVNDTVPPSLTVAPDPAQLWPPNHKFHDVHVDALAFDACDASPTVQLVDIFSSEPDNGHGDGNTEGDIQGADLGTDDVDFALRAERAGPGDGRTYTAVYQVTDHSGNATQADAVVVVPHDMGHGAKNDNGHDAEFKAASKEMAKDAKLSKKSFKAAMKVAKKQAKLNQKVFKAELKASRKAGN